MEKEVKLGIKGMTCPSCAKTVEALLNREAGVKKASVDYDSAVATVSFDSDETTAENLLRGRAFKGQYKAEIQE
jgi:copper chaperone CopZ